MRNFTCKPGFTIKQERLNILEETMEIFFGPLSPHTDTVTPLSYLPAYEQHVGLSLDFLTSFLPSFNNV